MSEELIRDYWTFTPLSRMAYRNGSSYVDYKKVLSSAKADTKPDAGVPTGILQISGPASFSGMITNNRVYPGKRMRKASKTWTQDYERPIQLHHDDFQDPIGRIKKASYSAYFGGTDFENDFLNPTKYGSGELVLTGRVTDLAAIEKIIDGRYKTLSVGFNPGALTCSICGADWLHSFMPCDHMPGRWYPPTDAEGNQVRGKERLCYLYTGDMAYHELSFVNRPAAKGAQVTSFKFLSDAIDEASCSCEMFGTCGINLSVDALQICGIDYEVVNPNEREVIEVNVSEVTNEVEEPKLDCASSKDDINISNVRDESRLSDQEGEVNMTDTSNDTTVTENTSTEVESAPSDTSTDTATPETAPQPSPEDVNPLKDAVAALEAKVEMLVEENKRLADQVQTHLAETLADLRIRTKHAAVIDKVDKRTELVELYKSRTAESLRDAIADERYCLQAEVTEDETTDESDSTETDLERGSVTAKDAGVLADTSSDELSSADEEEVARITPMSVRERMRQELSR